MLQAFESHIDTKLTFLKNAKLLVAISGGLDSVVLTYLCNALKLNIALAHCNFHLRGTESDDDESFVLNLAEQLDLEVFIEHFETKTYAEDHKISTQMAARELRYSWFSDLAEQLDFDYVLTAHHADDELETFIINLSRGTGLDGLTGISEIRGNIIRPLLEFSRIEIEAYAASKKLKWREDSSNASTKYLRNKIRHEVIPNLKELSENFLEQFKDTQRHLQQASLLTEAYVDTISRDIISVDEDMITFNIKKIQLLEHPEALLYQLLKDYKFTNWEDVYALLNAQSGKQVLSKDWRLLKDRDVLILTERTADHPEYIEIEDLNKKYQTSMGTLFFDEADALFGKRSDVIYVDQDKLKLPLTIRKWQKGDLFYPIGMKGKKKMSKFFKDEKYSLIDKEKALLLCSNQKVVWIIGKRADDRFKATESTANPLKIQLK